MSDQRSVEEIISSLGDTDSRPSAEKNRKAEEQATIKRIMGAYDTDGSDSDDEVTGDAEPQAKASGQGSQEQALDFQVGDIDPDEVKAQLSIPKLKEQLESVQAQVKEKAVALMNAKTPAEKKAAKAMPGQVEEVTRLQRQVNHLESRVPFAGLDDEALGITLETERQEFARLQGELRATRSAHSGRRVTRAEYETAAKQGKAPGSPLLVAQAEKALLEKHQSVKRLESELSHRNGSADLEKVTDRKTDGILERQYKQEDRQRIKDIKADRNHTPRQVRDAEYISTLPIQERPDYQVRFKQARQVAATEVAKSRDDTMFGTGKAQTIEEKAAKIRAHNAPRTHEENVEEIKRRMNRDSGGGGNGGRLTRQEYIESTRGRQE